MLKQHFTSYHLRRLPIIAGTPMHARRMASQLQKLQADFGKPVPAGRPGSDSRVWLYTVEPEGKRGSFKRYLRAAGPEKYYILGAIAGVCLYSAATLAIPAGFGTLIDHATKGALPTGTSFQLMGWVCAVGVANFVRLYCIGFGGERLIARLRGQLFKAIMKQPTAFFDTPDNRTGALVQRLSLDCNVMGSSLTEAVTSGTKNVMQCVGSIAVMLYYSPTLTGIIVGLLPPSVAFAAYYGRYVRKLQTSMMDALAEKGVVAEERLGNIRLVRAFGREQEEQSWYLKKVNKVLDLSLRMQRYNAGYVACLHCIGYITLYMMLWGGSLLVASDNLSAGHLFSFMLYTVYCGIGMTGLTNLVTDINKGYGASMRVYDIIDRAEQIEAAEKDAKTITPIEAVSFDLAFRDVDFAYPTRPEAPIFKKLNVQIPSGLCTCVVGASGSGKSTMGHLLAKLYSIDGGNIRLGDYDLAELSPKWLRARIGIVNQEPVLFGGTIAQNIAYGIAERAWDDPIDDWALSAVIEVAKQANAHDFIVSLPQGYDTYVGEGGRSLSGGQKQRIAIARALLRNPSLLILDEATSACDAISEIVVAAAIEKLIDDARSNRRRTVLMFAHKLSMIRKADKIIVLHNGAVADEGDFEHVSKNPLFRQLVGLDVATRKVVAGQVDEPVSPEAEAAAAREIEANARAQRQQQ